MIKGGFFKLIRTLGIRYIQEAGEFIDYDCGYIKEFANVNCLVRYFAVVYERCFDKRIRNMNGLFEGKYCLSRFLTVLYKEYERAA
jgi:hypothetical protein